PEAVEQRALCHLPSHHVRDPLPSAKSESRLHRRRKHAFFNSLERLLNAPKARAEWPRFPAPHRSTNRAAICAAKTDRAKSVSRDFSGIAPHISGLLPTSH
ncbi:hypothetical protein, partial [Sphingomonas corticis]|uniref:hypothetical protein n=1 Tax=Sphingomonas corticis TaxID=2722791 RepID=UPI001ADD622D